MHKQDAESADTHQSRSSDIICIAQTNKFTAHDSYETGHKHNAEGQNHFLLAGSQHTNQNKGEQNAGKSVDRIVHAHQNLIENASKIPCQRAQKDADCRCECHHAEADQNGRAAALHHTGKNIPSEIIGAEKMRKGGGRKLFRSGHSRRAVRCPK
jgi:hypothetical protein